MRRENPFMILVWVIVLVILVALAFAIIDRI